MMDESPTAENGERPQCDGICVSAMEVGVTAEGIAYPHPGCPLHEPKGDCAAFTPMGRACVCGKPGTKPHIGGPT